MTFEERKALVKSYLGKTVDIKIDRPIGSTHPKHPNLTYPINYGYIPNALGGDGEELDVYLLGVDEPVRHWCSHWRKRLQEYLQNARNPQQISRKQ